MMLVTYILMKVLPRDQQQKYVMGFVLTYLSYSHISRMVTNFGGWDIDVSLYTMLLVCKLSALGFCYSDGGKPESELTAD